MKIWTYIGDEVKPSYTPTAQELDSTEPLKVDQSDPNNLLHFYLLALFRSMSMRGYTFKPTAQWQINYLIKSQYSPGEYEETYSSIFGSFYDTVVFIDPSIQELMESSELGQTLLTTLGMQSRSPDVVVYYDESATLDILKEGIVIPSFVGYNLAFPSDVVKLSALASVKKKFTNPKSIFNTLSPTAEEIQLFLKSNAAMVNLILSNKIEISEILGQMALSAKCNNYGASNQTYAYIFNLFYRALTKNLFIAGFLLVTYMECSERDQEIKTPFTAMSISKEIRDYILGLDGEKNPEQQGLINEISLLITKDALRNFKPNIPSFEEAPF